MFYKWEQDSGRAYFPYFFISHLMIKRVVIQPLIPSNMVPESTGVGPSGRASAHGLVCC